MKLVLLPGMDGTGDLFGPLVEALPVGFETVVVRYPRARILDWRQLLQVAEDHLPKGQAYCLVAESFSGPLAIEIAARQPAGLRGLILCASYSANPMGLGLRGMHKLARPRLFKRRMPRVFVRHFLLDRRAPQGLVDLVRGVIDSVAPDVMASRVKLVGATDVASALRKVAVPVLYLQARSDRVVGSRGRVQVQAVLPDAQFETMDGPHLLLQRLPQESAERITRFVSGC